MKLPMRLIRLQKMYTGVISTRTVHIIMKPAASQQGEQGFGAFWAGANVGLIRDMEAGDLINQLVLEMTSH